MPPAMLSAQATKIHKPEAGAHSLVCHVSSRGTMVSTSQNAPRCRRISNGTLPCSSWRRHGPVVQSEGGGQQQGHQAGQRMTVMSDRQQRCKPQRSEQQDSRGAYLRPRPPGRQSFEGRDRRHHIQQAERCVQ